MKKFLIALSVIVIFGGIWYYSDVAAEPKTNNSTKVYEKTVFEKCNHSTDKEYGIPESAVGISGKQAAKVMECEYNDFKNNCLSVKKINSGYCGKHFRIFLDGNTIKAVSLQSGEIVSKHPTAPSQFSDRDTELLKSGIIVDSRQELASVMEDFTS